MPIALALLALAALGFPRSDSSDLPAVLSGLQRLIPEPGVVTFVEGRVEVKRPGSGWEPVYVGDRVRPDDSIRSGAKGRTEVSFGSPQRVLRVERESVVALGGAALGNRLVLVGARVERGAVWVKVAGSPSTALPAG